MTVTLASGDTDVATVSPDMLTFTPADWAAKAVTVTAVDDDDAVDETTTVSYTASGGGYDGVTASTTVTVDDDDQVGMTIPATLTVNEGNAETYDVELDAQPTGDVTVTLASADTDVATVSPDDADVHTG